MTRVGRAQEAPALTAWPARTSAATLAKRAGLVVLAAAVLFCCYWRQSSAAALSSDGSGNVLQAWDMLHGNLLLQLSAISILLLSPDHTGTAVPVLAIWLLIDRNAETRPRWFIAVLVGLAFALVMVADSIVLFTGIIPLALVCVLRACAGLIGRGKRNASWRYELAAGELMVPVFAVAIVLNLGAYMSSTHAQDLLGAREMAEVLPLGAVLAGRVLGDRILDWIRSPKSWLVPVLAAFAAGCLAALGYGAAQASVPAVNEPLASWLVAHGLTDGLATYWQANSTTVDSRRQVLLSAVVRNHSDRLVPYLWETDDADYDPALHHANFVVADGPSALPGMRLSAELTFGRPQRIYHADGYTILIWNTNLLAKLASPGG